MVYFESFEEFQAASREVYAREPRKARYSCKYSSHSDGYPEVVLKVTDDVSCIKFRTKHHSDLRYIDQFTQLVTIWMTKEDSIESDGRNLSTDLNALLKLRQQENVEMTGPKPSGRSQNQSARKKKRKA